MKNTIRDWLWFSLASGKYLPQFANAGQNLAPLDSQSSCNTGLYSDSQKRALGRVAKNWRP